MNITSSAAFNGQSRSPATNFHSVNSFRHQMSLVYQYIYQKKSTLLTSSRLPFHWFFIVLWAVYLPAVPLSEFMVKQALCPFFLQCLWEEKRAFSVGGGCTSMHQVCQSGVFSVPLPIRQLLTERKMMQFPLETISFFSPRGK